MESNLLQGHMVIHFNEPVFQCQTPIKLFYNFLRYERIEEKMFTICLYIYMANRIFFKPLKCTALPEFFTYLQMVDTMHFIN